MIELNQGQRMRLSDFGKYFKIFLLVSFSPIDSLIGQAQTPDSQPLNFESFLQYPPIVRKAVIEVESFSPDQPSSKETLLIKSDGANYFLEKAETNAVAQGRFNGIYWQMEHRVNLLALYDAQINASGSWSASGPSFEIGPDGKRMGPGFENENLQFMAKRGLNYLINLGVPALDRSKEVVWDKSQSLLLGKVLDAPVIKEELRGAPCVIQLQYSNTIPVSALVTLGNPGSVSYLIKYKYSPNLFAGQFPFEFTRFRDLQGDDNAKEWTVVVKELEISDHHLTDAEIDPRQIFISPKLETHFWSNNVAYETVRSGKLRQIFGPLELAKQNQLRLEHRHGDRLLGLRITLFSIFAISGICMVWFAVRKRQNN